MKNEENRVFSETEKTILFIHPAVQFTIDQSVTADAIYIKLAKEEWKESGEDIFYYLREMRAAAQSGKKYLVMEYEPIIGATIEALLLAPGQWNFCRWLMYTFLHADTCPEGAEPSPMYNANDEKMEVLRGLFNYPFIIKYSIPAGHTLTAADLQRMKKDFSGPETPEEFEELLRNKPKPLFPFYEIDNAKLKEFVGKRGTKSREK
jgi:hypothetical protein